MSVVVIVVESKPEKSVRSLASTSYSVMEEPPSERGRPPPTLTGQSLGRVTRPGKITRRDGW